MPLSTSQFWQLLGESRLLAPDQVQGRMAAFQATKGASQAGPQAAAQWLLAENVISRYQAKVLLAGRAGPFYYGDYRVAERYEAGRLAGLFQAVHVPSGHPVLLQFLSGAVTKDQSLWMAAVRMAQRARRIVVPQVSRLFELVDLATFKFAVYEELRGESLQRIAAGGNRLPSTEACRIARLAALGLSYLHQQGSAHGEVRPHNVWIEPHGNAKLLGAGLAHDLATPAGYFSFAVADPDGTMLTKADYLAPELARAGAQPTVLGDVYALGCTLYEMLAGRPPFAGGAAADKARRHATEGIEPLERFGVAPPLAQVVAFMMAKDPNLRYQQSGQLVEVLMNFVAPAAIQIPVERPPATLGIFQNLLEQRAPSAASAPATSAPAGKSPTAKSPAAPVINLSTDSPPVRSNPAASYRTAASSRSSDSTNFSLWIGGGVLAAILLVGFVVYSRGSSKLTEHAQAQQPQPAKPIPQPDKGKATKKEKPSRFSQPSATATVESERKVPNPLHEEPKTKGDTPENAAREETIDDDGKTLWASPTAGAPLDLKYLPPGGQIFLAARPAELLAGSEGERLAAALGPAGLEYLTQLEQLSGVTARDIEQVVVSIQADKTGELEASLVVRLRNAKDETAIADHWQGAVPATHKERTYYTVGSRAYFIPPGAGGRTFAIMPAGSIREVIEAGDAAPPLRREMEQMLADSDAARHFTLLWAPNYVFTDGRAVFSGTAASMRDPLYWFLGDDE